MAKVVGSDPYKQIKEVLVGSGTEADRVKESAQILSPALAAVADSVGAKDAAQIGFTKLREAGVPVSHALQIAGQAFEVAPHELRAKIAGLGDAIELDGAGIDQIDALEFVPHPVEGVPAVQNGGVFLGLRTEAGITGVVFAGALAAGGGLDCGEGHGASPG